MWPRELQVEALGKEKGLKERGIFCRGGKQVIGAQVLKFAWGKPPRVAGGKLLTAEAIPGLGDQGRAVGVTGQRPRRKSWGCSPV